MNNGTFDFNVFIKESKDVLVNPKSYFSAMKTTGGMIEPLIKTVIYGAIAGIFAFLWSILNIGAVTGGIFGGAFGIMLFIWYIIGAIIGLFILAVIILVISSICKGNTDFEANVRVTSALLVIMPISIFISFVGGINFYFGLIVSLAVSAYTLWLLYLALIEALKSKPETAKIAMSFFIAVFVLFLFIYGLGVWKKTNQLLNEFKNTDFKELPKEIEKN